MAAFSEALVEFANHHRQPAGPSIEVIETARYRIVIQPDFPIPGPNSVSWIRCAREEADELITEAHATIAPHRLPVMWTLDPETEPRDFGDYLMARDIHPDPHPEAAVMVLPIDAMVEVPAPAGLEIRDALADLATFRSADAVAAEAFMSDSIADSRSHIEMQERRRLNSEVAVFTGVSWRHASRSPAAPASAGSPCGAARCQLRYSSDSDSRRLAGAGSISTPAPPNRLGQRLHPRAVQRPVATAELAKLRRRTVLDHPPTIDDEHPVGDIDRRQAVGDDHRGAVAQKRP